MKIMAIDGGSRKNCNTAGRKELADAYALGASIR